MKNIDFYRDKLKKVADKNEVCSFKKMVHKKPCNDMQCSSCNLLFLLWLNEECSEPKVDFNSLPINTKVIATTSIGGYSEMYFAGFDAESKCPMISKDIVTPITTKDDFCLVGDDYFYTKIELKEENKEDI